MKLFLILIMFIVFYLIVMFYKIKLITKSKIEKFVDKKAFSCALFKCETGTGDKCNECQPITKRSQENHCKSCNEGYYLSLENKCVECLDECLIENQCKEVINSKTGKKFVRCLNIEENSFDLKKCVECDNINNVKKFKKGSCNIEECNDFHELKKQPGSLDKCSKIICKPGFYVKKRIVYLFSVKLKK